MEQLTSPTIEFIEALRVRDFDRIARCFDPGIHFRALVPPGLREATDADGAVTILRRWFAPADRFEILTENHGELGGRKSVSYRIRLHEDQWLEVEQHAFCTIENGRMTDLDLVCSGQEPISDPTG